MAPSRSLPRSASEIADPPSPFSSNPTHNPVSMPTAPASGLSSCSSLGRMAAPPTDTPPITPKQGKPKPTPAAAAAAYYASLWSPRRLMQRAARAFRTSRSHSARARMTSKDAAEERCVQERERVSSVVISSKVSDAATAVPAAAAPAAAGAEIASSDDAHGAGAVVGSVPDEQQPQQQPEGHHPEVVPEKIIHVADHHAPASVVATDYDGCGKTTTPQDDGCGKTTTTEDDGCGKTTPPEDDVCGKTTPPEDDGCGKTTTPAEEKETADAAVPAMEEEAETPKKGAVPEPVVVVVAAAAAVVEDVADKFVTVVKEAIRKHEAEQQADEKEVMRRFRGSVRRVKTAMEAREESEQPRRREVARSNDVIEEARAKLLEKRQCSRVKALVGAFETVMSPRKEDAAAAAAAPPPRVGLNQAAAAMRRRSTHPSMHPPSFVSLP